MSEEQHQRKHSFRRTLCAVILVIMGICILLVTFLLLFQVRRIEVRGNRYLSNQEVADWLETDEWSTNTVYLMVRYHFLDYELLPAMEDVRVSLRNPWTVRVDVQEKQIVGYIMVGDDAVYFDRDGVVLARTTEWWDDIPCIEGLSVDEVTLYEALPVSDENKRVFDNLLDMSMTLKKYELTPDRIVCSGAELHLYFGGVCAVIGDDNLADRIAQIPPILEKLGDQSGTLHLEHYDADNTSVSFIKDTLPEE